MRLKSLGNRLNAWINTAFRQFEAGLKDFIRKISLEQLQENHGTSWHHHMNHLCASVCYWCMPLTLREHQQCWRATFPNWSCRTEGQQQRWCFHHCAHQAWPVPEWSTFVCKRQGSNLEGIHRCRVDNALACANLLQLFALSSCFEILISPFWRTYSAGLGFLRLAPSVSQATYKSIDYGLSGFSLAFLHSMRSTKRCLQTHFPMQFGCSWMILHVAVYILQQRGASSLREKETSCANQEDGIDNL